MIWTIAGYVVITVLIWRVLRIIKAVAHDIEFP